MPAAVLLASADDLLLITANQSAGSISCTLLRRFCTVGYRDATGTDLLDTSLLNVDVSAGHAADNMSLLPLAAIHVSCLK
jgi:hypothetical protein